METFTAIFILIISPILLAIVLKFFLGNAPPSTHSNPEISDELFDEIEENPPPHRRRRQSKKRGKSRGTP